MSALPTIHIRRIAGFAALMAGLLALLAPAPGCGESDVPTARPDGPPRVVVTIPPLVGLVEPLLPDDAEITVLVESGRSVHGYEPSAEDIVALSRADVVVRIGMGLEGRVGDAVRHGGSRARLITMAEVLGLGDGHVHAHDHDHAHDEEACASNDAHLWLDPVLARLFVLELPGLLPEAWRARAEAEAGPLAERIAGVDTAYRDRLAPFAGRAIVTHHASMNRPAERYGLEVAAVLRTIETLEPSPQDIATARRAIADRGVTTVFVEPQFSGTAAERLAETAGVRLLVLDPLGDGDWLSMMETNLDRLVEGLADPAVTAVPAAAPEPASP